MSCHSCKQRAKRPRVSHNIKLSRAGFRDELETCKREGRRGFFEGRPGRKGARARGVD